LSQLSGPIILKADNNDYWRVVPIQTTRVIETSKGIDNSTEFTVETIDDSHVFLKDCSGKYLSSSVYVLLIIPSKFPNAYSEFKVYVFADGKVAFRTGNGRYLT